MINYLIRFPFWLAVIVLRYPLSFIAVRWFSEDGRLSFPFNWLGTIDNDLYGDSGWKNEHLWGNDPTSYINQVRWLWRNGGNEFNYWWIGVQAADRPGWAFWSSRQIPLFAGRFIDLRFGWTDYSLRGRCKYVFTARVKTKP